MVEIVYKKEDANCITHSGTMHADDVFATAFLEMYLDEVRLLRVSSIDPKSVSKDTFVYDVGRGMYDHHQIDAARRDNDIVYSSLGLLWRDFGRDFLTKRGFSNVEELFLGIDKDLIEGIDADDNGLFPKVDAPYKLKTLPSIIKIFNPSFDSYENESEQFLKAENIARMIFEEEILYVNGKILSDKKVLGILDKVDINNKYLILDEYLPYEEMLLTHENTKNILFVAFPSNRGGYAIKTVPKSIDDHTARLDFPLEWAGLQGHELEEVSGIEGLRFCHSARFIVNCENIECVYQVLLSMCKDM